MLVHTNILGSQLIFSDSLEAICNTGREHRRPDVLGSTVSYGIPLSFFFRILAISWYEPPVSSFRILRWQLLWGSA